MADAYGLPPSQGSYGATRQYIAILRRLPMESDSVLSPRRGRDVVAQGESSIYYTHFGIQ